jgi:hypothetical protein
MTDSLDEIPFCYDIRKGLTVQQLIDRLEQIQDKNKFVALTGYDGISGVNTLKEVDVSGYAGTYSFQITSLVVLSQY